MKAKLKNIADIQLGFSFRSKINKDKNGNVRVIQMKNLADEYVNVNNLDKTEIQEVKGHYTMRKGDLIFKTRGLDTTACLLNTETKNAILAAPLLRIRVKSQNILPEYLLWYINQSRAQAFLNSRAKGTFQKMITKQVLEELEIEVPSIERQKKIVDITLLAKKELALIHRLAKKKAQYLSKVLLDSIKEIDHGD